MKAFHWEHEVLCSILWSVWCDALPLLIPGSSSCEPASFSGMSFNGKLLWKQDGHIEGLKFVLWQSNGSPGKVQEE